MGFHSCSLPVRRDETSRSLLSVQTVLVGLCAQSLEGVVNIGTGYIPNGQDAGDKAMLFRINLTNY